MSRQDREIKHGKEILDKAEFYWGWGTPAGKERLRRRTELLVEHAGLKPGVLALEIGCGKGLYTRELAQSGAAIVPIDISWDLLNGARQNTADGDYLAGDAHRLPFAESSFDAVCGVSVLHHLDVERVLAQSIRALKPEGRFVFSEPNMLNPQILIQKNVPIVKKLMGDSPDETAFWKWRLQQVVEAHGFQVVRIEPFDFLHPWIPSALIPAVDKAGRFVEKIPLVREIAGSLLIVAKKK